MTVAVRAEIRSGCRIVGTEALRAIGRVLLRSCIGLAGGNGAADNGASRQAADQCPGAATPMMMMAITIMPVSVPIVLHGFDRGWDRRAKTGLTDERRCGCRHGVCECRGAGQQCSQQNLRSHHSSSSMVGL